MNFLQELAKAASRSNARWPRLGPDDPQWRSDPFACSVAVEDLRGQAYNEQAFRHFLSIERKRSERSGRSLLLLALDLQEEPGISLRIDPTVAGRLFSTLWRCLRDTDFMGWYREERVVAAALIQFMNEPLTEVSNVITQRVRGVSRQTLPADVARRLHVHVYQLAPRLKR